MVLQRTIEDLRDRPTHEREAVAFWIAIVVIAVLFMAWGVYFFRSVGAPDLKPVNDAYTQAVQQVQAQSPYDTSGWASQTQSAASAASVNTQNDSSGQIQIVQQDDGSSYVDPTTNTDPSLGQ
jgi:uncharacterized protein YpmB